MDNMDNFRERLEALEQQTKAMETHTRTIELRLLWWRGLACGFLVLSLLTWALPSGTAQEEASEVSRKGLEHRVTALEKLLKHFSRDANEVTIAGANLHIVNGLGSTDCRDEQFELIPDCPNGLGNLIVGYNEPRLAPGQDNIRTGSHNVVVGSQHNFSSFGGLVAGRVNEINGQFAAVSGGEINTASAFASSVSGGILNTATGEFASVSGGDGNTASCSELITSGALLDYIVIFS
jgi:hypothetical protein